MYISGPGRRPGRAILPFMQPPLKRPTTPATFLAWEEGQALRWEFDGSEAVPRMTGTVAHALISANIIAQLAPALAGTRWVVLGADLKIATAGSIRYPDAFVARRGRDPRATVVHDPVVVFEVLGDETAAGDLLAKNRDYQATPSVRRYVMLAQDRIAATVFARDPAGWLGRLLGAGDTLALPEIGVRLDLAALYAGIELPARPGEAASRRCPISIIVSRLREAIERVRSFRHGGLGMARQTAVRRQATQPRDERPAKPRPEPAEATDDQPQSAPAPFLAALDVGYSNLKLLAGERGSAPTATLLPAGAGPAGAMPLHPQTSAARGSRIGQDGLAVQVDGAAWAAGVEPSRLQNWERELHPDYPATAGYRALVHAALLAAGRPRIDLLVTGLPVSQWLDPAQRQALQARLTGTHAVTPARDVEVAEVYVLPQPAGAYFDFSAAEPEAVAEARVLVVDSGFFSVDWVLFDEGAMRGANSGTSTAAVSLVLETAADLIRADHGSRIDRDLLERALRTGAAAVPLFGRPVELAPYLTEAAKQTAPVALTAVRQTLRGERREVDLVLLAGGGAATYAEATRQTFPRARVVVPDAPVLANVRGFWLQANRPEE